MSDTLLVYIILAATIVLFMSERLRLDVVALMSLLALAITGVLTPAESLAGFSDPVVIMIAALFVVAGAMLRTGLAEVREAPVPLHDRADTLGPDSRHSGQPGREALTLQGITLRLVIKVNPGSQWKVLRALRQEIRAALRRKQEKPDLLSGFSRRMLWWLCLLDERASPLCQIEAWRRGFRCPGSPAPLGRKGRRRQRP